MGETTVQEGPSEVLRTPRQGGQDRFGLGRPCEPGL